MLYAMENKVDAEVAPDPFRRDGLSLRLIVKMSKYNGCIVRGSPACIIAYNAWFAHNEGWAVDVVYAMNVVHVLF